MTVDLEGIAAAVDLAVSARAREDWERHARPVPAVFTRRRVFRACGREYGYLLAPARLPRQCRHSGPDGDGDGVGSTDPADELRSAFRDLGTEPGPRVVFVQVTTSFLAGDLPIPRRPDRVVVEVDARAGYDTAVRDGLVRVKALGCRVSLADFTGCANQRRLLPLADYVKIDARDLDVEGRPLLDLAASRGAQLVADCVNAPATLRQCRGAGFGLVQGRALERSAPGPTSDLLRSARG